jgi:transposase-like protein
VSETKSRSLGRPTKLNKTLQGKIVKLLKQGISVEDVCSQVGIAVSTYYNWIGRGQALADQLDADPETFVPADERPFLEFLEAVTRALQNAKVKAIGAIYGAIQGQKTVEKSKSTFEEIRWRQTKDGKKPYKYRRTSTSEKVIQHAPDSRIAIEYLKRRYPDEWSDRLRIDVDPGVLRELQALATSANTSLEDLLKAVLEELKSSDDIREADRP